MGWGLVKVATFNINNINKRLDNLLDWLAKAEPDVVSLQELKAEQGAFPVKALRTLGYEAVWQGERSWNGVACSQWRNLAHPIRTRSWKMVEESIRIRSFQNPSEHSQ